VTTDSSHGLPVYTVAQLPFYYQGFTPSSGQRRTCGPPGGDFLGGGRWMPEQSSPICRHPGAGEVLVDPVIRIITIRAIPAMAGTWAETLTKTVGCLPAQNREKPDGGLLDYAVFRVIGVITARCSLISELLPISCRCIADTLPINGRIEHAGRDRLPLANHLSPNPLEGFWPCARRGPARRPPGEK